MLAELLVWWVTQMRAMLPAGLWRATPEDAHIVTIDRLEHLASGETGRLTGTILQRQGGVETEIGPLDFSQPERAEPGRRTGGQRTGGRRTGLRLPRDAVLCREVLLPLAAARDLRTVIGFEIDRLTPFSAAELYWGVNNLHQDRARGRLRLDLLLVPRALVENLRAALLPIGLAPSFIETAQGRIELGREARPVARLARFGLAAFCGILAVACVVSPFLRQQVALDAASRSIATQAKLAQTAMTLRRQLAIAASGQAAMAQARRAGDALQVLASITDALPDGTWISDFTLKSGDLTFDGRSSAAAALIARLSSAPGLQDPSFTAPITRPAGGSADQFSVHVSVRE